MRSLFARLHRRYGKKITGDERQTFVAKLVEKERKELAHACEAKPEAYRGKRPRVAIVGAGFAGLMAGYTLRKQFNITIFEARDRIGGRVWSKSKSSGIVEAGAELIGYNHPLWMLLGREFELGFSVNTSDTNFDALHLEMPLRLDGHRIRKGQLEGLYDKMDEAFAKMARQAQHISARHPWTATRARHLDDMSVAHWIDHLHLKGGRRPDKLVRLALQQQFSNDGGLPCSKQSYLANLAVVAGGALPHHPAAFFSQSENLRCSLGNQSLAERLAEEIKKAHGVIHTLSPVNAIAIDGDRVTIEAEGRSPEVADYVILAVPPSLWPGASGFSRLQITPELPPDYKVTMGKAVKYLSPLKGRFWINDGLAPTATSTSFGVTWEGTDNQIAPPGRDVELSLFAGDRPALSALRAWKAGGSQAVNKYYAKRIGKVYKEYAKNLSQPPEFMAWPEDPWTGGGYSCFARGEVCRAGPLLQKAFEKRMFFAGEHTCFAYMGYMEGALQSGKKAAQSIITAAEREAAYRNAERSARRRRITSRR